MLYVSQGLVAVKCGLHVFIAAIEAMKNAHKEEMEKTHRSQLTGLNSDIDELRLQYEYVFVKIFSDISGEADACAAVGELPLHLFLPLFDLKKKCSCVYRTSVRNTFLLL